MKSINILSLIQAYSSLSSDEYNSFIKNYNIDIKRNEVDDLKTLSAEMYEILPFVSIFNNFYIGYKIQHISKEFDLLRFGSNYIINVEIKKISTTEKIKRQLKRNNYYLGHINKVIHNFCFISQKKTLYKLNSVGEIEVVELTHLVKLLTQQNLMNLDNPDNLFNPSEYLVSPFNSTDKFINNQYFLTSQQEVIKDKVIDAIENNTTKFMAITGGPGTGKTLLTYDVIKTIRKKKRTLIVHCGQLNDGHARLITKGWNITAIKELKNHDLSSLDLVLIDETQRIYISQFNKILDDAETSNFQCIFSYDKQQTLSVSETNTDIDSKINSIRGIVKYALSDKIRTNKEIANFIKLLFNNQRNDVVLSSCENISFDYFTDLENVRDYISLISDDGWEVLRLTPSQYKREHHESYSHIESKTSHKVIGQEFDNVAVVIDKHFYYHKTGRLLYNSNTYYDTVKMLFQNITRTRKKLKLIVIDNKQVLSRCLSILN
ncbi:MULTISPECIES: DNA/RNA helicase domain-containing protein [unclassified Aeromonas]|uniref:DNA/RNA helicase domain-containing protein n=1 Tax=Aeromonas TaxID=642 RepID=UPI0035278189